MSFLSQPITITSLLGLDKKRLIGSIEVQVIITENAKDVLTITKQPIQQGAQITDHAYKEPAVFSMQIRFQDNLSTSLPKIYQNLLDLQNSFTPFDVTTPKRIYRNMLLANLEQITDKTTENVLALNCVFQEVIIVNVATTQVPRSRLRSAGRHGATQAAGKKSALLTGAQAFAPNITGFLK